MPNWCENNLTVRGPEAEIKRFLDGIKMTTDKDGDGHHNILDGLYPIPEELESISGGTKLTRIDEKGLRELVTDEDRDLLIKTFGAYSSYDWCIKNWGTKWGDCYTELQKQDNENLLFYFESAWGPPLEGFTKVAKDFPQLIFYLTYEEPGMCFEGYAKWINGELVEDLSQESVRFEITDFGQPWRKEVT